MMRRHRGVGSCTACKQKRCSLRNLVVIGCEMVSKQSEIECELSEGIVPLFDGLMLPSRAGAGCSGNGGAGRLGATCATLLCPHLVSTEHDKRSVEWLDGIHTSETQIWGHTRIALARCRCPCICSAAPSVGDFWDFTVLRNRAFSPLSGIKELSRAVTDYVCDTRNGTIELVRHRRWRPIIRACLGVDWCPGIWA